MSTTIESFRQIKFSFRIIRQSLVAINLLHKVRPYRQCHCGTLTHTHRVEVNITVITAYPTATDKLRCETHKPGITITVCSTSLTAYLSRKVVLITQSARCTTVNNSL